MATVRITLRHTAGPQTRQPRHRGECRCRHTLPYGDNLARTVFRRFIARDTASRVEVALDPGASIESFRIHRNAVETTGTEVYCMEFVSEGRQLRCALVEFQA